MSKIEVTGNGQRKDSGKIRMSAIPPQFITELARHCNANQFKYPDINGMPNWTAGMSYSKLLDPLERHLQLFKDGQTYDYEQVEGTNYRAHHLIAIAWACMALYWYEINRTAYSQFDDRIWSTGLVDTHIDRKDTDNGSSNLHDSK